MASHRDELHFQQLGGGSPHYLELFDIALGASRLERVVLKARKQYRTRTSSQVDLDRLGADDVVHFYPRSDFYCMGARDLCSCGRRLVSM